MATKQKAAEFEETFTIVTPEKKPEYEGPMVSVFIPALEENGQGGMKVDQYEYGRHQGARARRW